MTWHRVDDPMVGAARSPVTGLWRALGLTVASAVVWGVAHIFTGRRASGFALMGLFVSLIAGSVAVGLIFPEQLKQVAVQRTWLDGITAGILVLALVWAAIVFRSFQVVQPLGLPASMRVISSVL